MRARTGLSAGSTRWWLPSWPDPLPAPLRVPIDHVLVAGDLAVEQARLGASFGSDHRPLLATIRIGR
jgi:endonuclease/exonuclease/phosphatase (EEP) superfamily protein YafD